MNHIQWLRFRPARASLSTVSKGQRLRLTKSAMQGLHGAFQN
jgi:hypothetical protein